MVTLCTVAFNTSEIIGLAPTRCISAFRMIITLRRDYVSKEFYPVGLRYVDALLPHMKELNF
jgi:hypothetical protein